MTWFFRDERGRVILWQRPNLPLVVWIAAAALSWIAEGRVHDVAALIAFGAGFTWAWLELFDGSTPYRRVLGAGVLAFLIVTRL